MGEDVEMPELWVRRGIGLGGAGEIVRGMNGLQTPSSTGFVGRRCRPGQAGLLMQSIPMAAVLGSWLQGLIAPGMFEGVGHLRLMAVLADDIGVAAPGSSCYDAFWQLQRRKSLTDLAAVSAEVADRCRSLRNAIDTHMRDRAVRTVLEPPEVEWQRVRVGYEFLSKLPVKRGALAVLRSARRGAHSGRSLLTSSLMHHCQIGAVS
jgi:hypothetical protein